MNVAPEKHFMYYCLKDQLADLLITTKDQKLLIGHPLLNFQLIII